MKDTLGKLSVVDWESESDQSSKHGWFARQWKDLRFCQCCFRLGAARDLPRVVNAWSGQYLPNRVRAATVAVQSHLTGRGGGHVQPSY